MSDCSNTNPEIDKGVTVNNIYFGDILIEFIHKEHRTIGWIAEQTNGYVPKQTIQAWTNGTVKRPRDWVQLLYVAKVLKLTVIEVDQLLEAARYPHIESLLVNAYSKESHSLPPDLLNY